MIAANSVSFTAGDKDIVRPLSLEIRPGKVLALMGPNGAGKTSLLRILSGEVPPTGGSVSVNGKAMRAYSRKELAQLRAVLSQSPDLAFDLRVNELVMLGRNAQISGRETEADYAAVDRALSAVDVLEIAERSVASLSGGERQRVHFARVLAQIDNDSPGPKYLFLDEPTSSTDIAHQHELLDRVAKLAREGFGVLVVLHDLNLAARYADDLVLMNKGEVIAAGPVAETIREDLIRLVFRTEVIVQKHPCYNCPLVIQIGTTEQAFQATPGLYAARQDSPQGAATGHIGAGT